MKKNEKMKKKGKKRKEKVRDRKKERMKKKKTLNGDVSGKSRGGVGGSVVTRSDTYFMVEGKGRGRVPGMREGLRGCDNASITMKSVKTRRNIMNRFCSQVLRR